jgi:hypothetical protein
MESSGQSATVTEVVGVFVEASHLQAAMGELLASGFSHDSIGLLAAERTVRRALSDYYAHVAESGQDKPGGPKIAFVERESVGDTVRSGRGGLFFAGATATAGAIVASAGVLGGALLAAASGVGALGAIGAGLAMLIRKSDAEYLQEQVDEGHLLLFVRTRDADEETRAKEVLSKHAALDVRRCTLARSE